jgi:very-short-patch-repair endonuclease
VTLHLAPVSPLEGEMSAVADRGGYADCRQVRDLRLRPVTPLCRLRRHLPLKWGEGRLRQGSARIPGEAGYRRRHFDLKALIRQPIGGVFNMPHREVSKSLRGSPKALRRNMTDAEKKLWRALRGHRLENISFRRQIPIAGYVVDFASPGHKLIVELDGSHHGEARGLIADRKRDRVLAELGWTVLRFWNVEVTEDLDGVCRKIMEACGLEDRA